MSNLYLLVVGVTVMTLTGSRGQSVDMTLLPGAFGAAVVDAVVDKIHGHCLFNNDRLFLRRLAYVETHDGNDPKTYRQGYYGGIWQVDHTMLTATQSCANIIKRECDIIRQEFGIDWTKVTWSQLRMPLYSGLAASLYVLQRLGNLHHIPGDIAGQADIWAHYYHLNEPEKTYVDLAADATKYVCSGELDLAFLVDSSGSILRPDFTLQLDFVANVVNALPVDSGLVQVAAVNFGTIANVSFTLDRYSNSTQVIHHIQTMSKDDGGTNTPKALELTRKVVFSNQHGARPTARKVAVLLTDGESYNTTLTVQQAQLLRNEGVLVLAIGVGQINIQELMDVASQPPCSHVYTLDTYAHIDSILYEIQKSTCEAPRILTPSQPLTGQVGQNGTTITISTTKPVDNSILAIRTNCSISDIYVSYTNQHPSPALYDHKMTASDGRPVFLTLSDQLPGLPVYITVASNRINAACLDYLYHVNFQSQPAVDIVCREKSTYRDCHPEDFIGSPFENVLCPDLNRPVHNPCGSTSSMVYPHPYDVHYFIKCDLQNKMYLTLCPDGDIFNPSTLACGFVNHEVADGIPLPPNYPNPCSPDVVQQGLYFFAYADDRHKYIQCDIWGGAWLKNCQTHHIWNDQAHTCVPDHLHEFDSTTIAPVEINNPCTPQALAAGVMFFPHPCDHSKYIHCDIAGNYYIQSCAPGMFFDPSSFVCLVSDPQPHDPACATGK